ncbi:PDZ domain-containing protein [Anaplasmataceae bacterium AB001_6]|nr:PDZ domain-containing protein [Anaplasmataceae bacterium AB001_6]
MMLKFLHTRIRILICIFCAYFLISNLGINNAYTKTVKHSDPIDEVMWIVKNYYVKNIDDDTELYQNAIKGIMQSLDEYSYFISEKDMKKFNDQISGTFDGFGINIARKRGLLMIDNVFINSPAEKSGIKKGDIIRYVNGDRISTHISAKSATQIIEHPEKKSLTLTIIRDGVLLTFDLKSKVFEIYPLALQEECDFLYIKISHFMEGVAQKIKQELKTRLKKNNYKGLIIDLRHNSGGVFTEAIQSADLFLDDVTIAVVADKKDSEDVKVYTGKKRNTILNSDIPITVLIDRNTASAAEIFSAALQDNERALLIGEQTYGKGSLQTVISLDTIDAAVSMTTDYLYTPNGKAYNKIGIRPDIFLPIEDVLSKDIESKCNVLHDGIYMNDNQANYAMNLILRQNK